MTTASGTSSTHSSSKTAIRRIARSTSGSRSIDQFDAWVSISWSMRAACSATPSTSRTVCSCTGCASSASRSRSSVEGFPLRMSASQRTSTARLRALDRAAIVSTRCSVGACSVDAAEVPAVAGVDLQLLAGGDEQRHLDLRAGLQRGGLRAAGRAVALQARVGVLDDELHGHRQLDEQWYVVVHGDGDLGVLEEVVRAAADGPGSHVDLVE